MHYKNYSKSKNYYKFILHYYQLTTKNLPHSPQLIFLTNLGGLGFIVQDL